eukprot:TRINITY_DN46230_c0_g1_i1.p1 TRINITY_DN46230_c0_g1~~TRINITY_DN46230_c0_g1_i1.p1  ORF type:complete len:360 (+),score=28.66 TRINITY_DN46230_c0_g1_i1:1-1080(+)
MLSSGEGKSNFGLERRSAQLCVFCQTGMGTAGSKLEEIACALRAHDSRNEGQRGKRGCDDAANVGETILAILMAYHYRPGLSHVQRIPKPIFAKISGFVRNPPALVTKTLDEYYRQRDPDTWDGLVSQIMAASERQEKALALETECLASIPSCIGQCLQLERITLCGDSLVTLPAQIGNLTELSYLQTYCCGVLFYPFELLNCKRLYVHGDSLYIDLSSLLGRNAWKFPQIPSANESSTCHAAKAIGRTEATLAFRGVDATRCSWCQTAWPSSEFTTWMQGRFPGGDRRDVLPLLARFCSQTCLDCARQRHSPSTQEFGRAKMHSCVDFVVKSIDRNTPSRDLKEVTCKEVLHIVQSCS